MVKIKRIYDEPAQDDGTRVLVDRLWPRGISKERAAIDTWLKDIAPSTNLRVWFGHKPERFEEFKHTYFDELSHNPTVATLEELIRKNSNLTLLYAAKSPEINHAVVLQDYLQRQVPSS